MNNSRKIFLILFVMVLLPALFYSVYEITSLDETEEMIGQMYDRQLDAILFSVNQYVLDVASSWATQIENDLPRRSFEPLLSAHPSIRSIIIGDTALSTSTVVPFRYQSDAVGMRSQRSKIRQLIRYQSLSYRKLEPVIVSDTTMMILFAPAGAPTTIIGVLINNDSFIENVIGKKLSDIAQNDFILSVNRISTGNPVFSTFAANTEAMTHQRALWIFPDHVIKIRLRGITIQEAANERYRRNISLIIVFNIVLLSGAYFVYRLIKREMELVALKSDFVSNVSHELRTPLALIRMFAETLEMKRVKTEKKKQEYYGIILHETERLTRLINNILNFSRMESNTRKFVFAPADLNHVIRSVLTIYSYQFEKLQFVTEISLAENLPSIPIDEEAIAEALHNLIDNAIKYSKEEKFIRIATSLNGQHVQLQVEDHGIGISPAHQSKIFDKFYRVSHGLVHTAKGSGLGLAIVHHIVQSHGGTITVTSTVGKGSTFTMILSLIQRP